MLERTKGEFSYELIRKSIRKEKCEEYRDAVEMQALCKNNLLQYEESKELILRCMKFHEIVLGENRKYYELSKEYAKILSNSAERGELLKALRNILILLEDISEEFSTHAEFSDCKADIEERIRLINEPEKHASTLLQKDEENLPFLEKTKGTNNVFYITSLKNKLYLQLNI